MWAGGVAPTAGDPVPANARSVRRGCKSAEIHGPASALPGLLCSVLPDRGEELKLGIEKENQ